MADGEGRLDDDASARLEELLRLAPGKTPSQVMSAAIRVFYAAAVAREAELEWDTEPGVH
ncbi:MAG: hypothetical protein F4Z60_12250 [Chloroflexi bacterium]|nr:hypothetical protein [Chloroflexota bacterium]